MKGQLHTPDPWKVDEEYVNEHGNLVSIYVAALNGGRIGQVFANCLVKTDDELRANARLFSAAPALLAALQRIYLETGESSIANIALAAIDAARAE